MEKKARIAALIGKGSTLYTEADAKMLDAATEEQLTRFEAAADAELAATKAVKDAAAKKEKDEKDEAARVAAAAQTPKTPTFDEVLATASADVQESVKSVLKTASDKKTATIKVLKDSKRCTFSDEKLASMSQVELDSLITLAAIVPATDYSLAGIPAAQRTAEGQGSAVPAATGVTPEAIRAAKAKK